VALVALAACVLAGACGKARSTSTSASTPTAAGVSSSTGAAPLPDPLPASRGEGEEVADDTDVGAVTDAGAPVEKVTIKVIVDQRRQAHVWWGRKDFGVAPLEIVRPRSSGPLDLQILAPGCLPLHTRVFTDHDEKIALRLYSESEAPGLLGYRASERPDVSH
jgi:hypothetical protein